LAVVGGADHDGAVDVAFHEGHDHFLTHARDEGAAPVGERAKVGLNLKGLKFWRSK
jgi:hypothetical protein